MVFLIKRGQTLAEARRGEEGSTILISTRILGHFFIVLDRRLAGDTRPGCPGVFGSNQSILELASAENPGKTGPNISSQPAVRRCEKKGHETDAVAFKLDCRTTCF